MTFSSQSELIINSASLLNMKNEVTRVAKNLNLIEFRTNSETELN